MKVLQSTVLLAIAIALLQAADCGSSGDSWDESDESLWPPSFLPTEIYRILVRIYKCEKLIGFGILVEPTGVLTPLTLSSPKGIYVQRVINDKRLNPAIFTTTGDSGTYIQTQGVFETADLVTVSGGCDEDSSENGDEKVPEDGTEGATVDENVKEDSSVASSFPSLSSSAVIAELPKWARKFLSGRGLRLSPDLQTKPIPQSVKIRSHLRVWR